MTRLTTAASALRPASIFGWLIVTLLTAGWPGIFPAVRAAEHAAPSPLDSVATEQAPMDLCRAPEDGYLAGELYGALRETVDWQGGIMECGGMQRPDNGGIRLVFAAPRQDERLLILLGIDGNPEELIGKEHVTNVTIIDEPLKRFYSSGGQERCWSQVERVAPVTGSDDRQLQISGKLYCAGSLPSLSDNRSVTLGEMRFSGRLVLEPADEN